jgi:DNA-binding NarL/FixJ family response regulator
MDKEIDNIKVFIIEDQPVALSGMVSWFKDHSAGIEVVGCAINVTEAIKSGIPEDVKVISLDLYLKDTPPVYNLLVLRAKYPDMAVVIFSSEDSKVWIKKMIKNGASAYLDKGISMNEYCQALHIVAKGEKIVPEELFQDSQDFNHSFFCVEPMQLNAEQQKIVAGMMNGKTYKEIADELNSTEAAVDKRFARLRKKFNASNNVQLIMNLLTPQKNIPHR